MKKLFLFILLCCGGAFSDLKAQTTSNKSHTATLNLGNTITIYFTSGANGVTLNFNTANDYSNGVTATNVAVLQVKSNKKFNVTVKASSANFTSSSTTVMPVSVLSVKANSGSFVSLSSSNKNLVTNQNKGTRSFNISYKATPGFNYNGGTYTTTVIYTATQL